MKNVDNFLLAPLNSLRTLKIERVEMNCSPCFTSSVRSEPLEIIGQCFENGTLKFLNFSSSPSVQCTEKFSSQKFVRSSENRNRTTTIVVATLLSSVFLLVLIFALVFLYRCRKPKEIKQNPIDHRTSQLFNPVFVDSTKTENDFYRQTRKTSVSDASSQWKQFLSSRRTFFNLISMIFNVFFFLFSRPESCAPRFFFSF